jgi:hypothetical protein
MKIINHTRDRNKLVRGDMPDWQTQMDAIWNLFQALALANPALAAQIQQDPTFQKIQAAKAKFPKKG